MKKKLLIGLILIIVVIAGGFGVYVGNYYEAEEDAIDCAAYGTLEENITWYTQSDSAEKGIIFYPGGKVESESYAPLMKACAEEGFLCAAVKMPYNLAVFDVDAAEEVMAYAKEFYPDVKEWYIAGHSLGGSMAASYAGENNEALEGVILLAAYSTADLAETELDVLSIYGDQDKVLNMEKYEKYRDNLPQDTKEIVIEGGCHAYFGKYGMQEGDGNPSITQDKQIEITAKAIAEFIS